jgi:ATP-dependent HslUV protease subunit HslV
MQLTRPATFAKLWPRIRRKGVTRMSILVAVKKNDRVAIAADTMHSTGSRREHADNLVGRSKLRRVGRSVLGGVGWSVYDNILEHYLNRYKRPPSFRDERAVFTFFLKFWKTLKDKYQVVNDQPDRDDRTPFCDLDSEFIVASPRTIYQISSDLTVMQFDKYVAIGSGERYAYGALHALYDSRRSADQIARQATEAAVHYDQYCGGKVEVFKL